MLVVIMNIKPFIKKAEKLHFSSEKKKIIFERSEAHSIICPGGLNFLNSPGERVS